MKSGQTLSNLIHEQIKLEKEIAEKLQRLEHRVDSVAATLLIREMQLDTKKHAEILQEALKVIDAPKAFWDYTIHVDADKRAVQRELEAHVKIEEQMMQQFKEQATKTDDEALKMLLEHFVEDEKKHHRYLKTILSTTYKMDL